MKCGAWVRLRGRHVNFCSKTQPEAAVTQEVKCCSGKILSSFKVYLFKKKWHESLVPTEQADEMFPWQQHNKHTVVSVPLVPGGH